ncbi:hypothetical protein CEE36_02600 [candidate division TA06 bacterium B3_TA06]|uniref:DUF4349 domain-containing protein n=1 Tax=candidate division TA06 bacterium B3_TA06 TaxID=2012487 RepID=A0A532VAM8_UNCT6|nr:MAG: hypothetical protein CEE36_02600 [candidate division TA06 bacterium B3_TA06]
MKRWISFLVVLLALGGLLGCRGKGSAEPKYDEGAPMTLSRGDVSFQSKAASGAQMAEMAGGKADILSLPSTRMIIKRASLSIRVKDVDAAYTRAVQLTEESGGYVQSSTISETEGARAELTVKVAPGGFIHLISAFEELGVVQRKQISGQDVTEEYYDLEAQLQTQLELRKRLFGHLNRARNVEEIIKVEHELQRVDGNVNRIKGRIKYLETMAAESTINLTLCSKVTPRRVPSRYWSNVWRGVVNTTRVLVKILVGILLVLVILVVPLALIGWGIERVVVCIIRKRKRDKAKN